MTPPTVGPAAPHVVVTGEVEGAEVARFALAHGQDPVAGLGELGWVALVPTTAQTTAEGGWTVVVTYAVRAGHDSAVGGSPWAVATADDDGLTDAERAVAAVHQRVAAYALVTSARGLLVTEVSGRTNAAGKWNLPGGGLDRGERVVAAVEREVWEETDQRVTEVALVGVQSSHWVGRASSGVVEDYHAIRLFHTARCPEPTDPRVNDVGGSTSAAAWVPLDATDRVPFVGSLVPLIDELIARHPARA